MAIDVSTAMKQIQEDIAPKIGELEKIIDSAILKSNGRFPVTISTSGNDYNIIQKCIGNYKQIGWNAKYTSDQRDGDYISISPQKKSSLHPMDC